ncbi:MAG TPA: hypothetical protein VGJ51_09670 [Candidatus Angelobacter sp.]
MGSTVENDLYDSVSVELPRKGWWVSRLLFAMAGILLGLIGSVVGWNHDRTHDTEGMTLYILCAAMAVLFGLIACLRAVARYWISVSPTEVTCEMTTLGTRDIRRYARSEVANLRVDERGVFMYRRWLAVDRYGKREFLGAELDKSKLDGLLDPIYSRFPEIAPEKNQ